jgi:hypothetical protein
MQQDSGVFTHHEEGNTFKLALPLGRMNYLSIRAIGRILVRP